MTLRRTVATLVAAAAIPLINLAGPLSAQSSNENRPALLAHRLEDGEQLRLDGILDEAAWQRAVPITEFRQQEPVEGDVPTEQTEIRILFDRDNLYIGAILYDSEPDRILAHQRERDAGLGTDDRFMWILDTFLDGRSGYFFEINPAGLMGDGLLRPGGGFGVNKSWDGIWEAQVSRADYGWSAEIRIPFRTLNFNPELDSWGINFQRTVRRKNEEIVWSGYLRNQGLFSPIHAGRLIGLRDISQGVGAELKPFVTSGRNTDGTSSPFDVGFDLSYSITPSLRASATVNTDFAEVEVDQRRVNLTRFPISYPERRDFFLEGSGVFGFARGNRVQPFFSRRIGLSGGEPVPILYGGRLAGQVGRNDLGFYQVRTGATGAVPAEDFTAARLVHNIFEQSSIGGLYTRRGTHGVGGEGGAFGSHTFGTDLELVTSRFRGDRNLQLQTYFMSHTAALGDSVSSPGDRIGFGGRVLFDNDPWVIRTSYRQLGNHFDPVLGFHARRGFRRVQPNINFTPRLRNHRHIRQLEFELAYEHLMNLDFEPETIRTEATLLGVSFHSGDHFMINALRMDERLDSDAVIQSVVIPSGDYTTLSWSAQGSTAGHRVLAGDLEVGGGQFWSGNHSRFLGGLTLRPAPGVTLRTNWEHNEVRLREGEFTANLLQLTTGWHVSPWSSVTGNLQYDNESELVGLYARFRWIVRPGSDLYLVYTHNWLNTDYEMTTLSRSGATKLTYTHRF